MDEAAASGDKAAPAIIPIRPLFALAPDALLRNLTQIVLVKMQLRESQPQFVLTMELYRDRAPSAAVLALAEYLGEPSENMRLFPMNYQRQYLIDLNLTHETMSGTLEEHIRAQHQFVYEVLGHSVDLFKTHIQASVAWSHGDAAMTTTTVLPMCHKQGNLNDMYLAMREMLIKEGVTVPLEGARIRVLELEGNIVRRTWPLTTSGAEVWDWHQGYSNPSKRIRMEAVPEDQLEYTDNQLLWCHSFNLDCNGLAFQTSGAPFAMSVRAGETAANFRLRLAARLGESSETLAHSWRICRCVGIERYEPIADDAVLQSLGRFPTFLPFWYHRMFQDQEGAPEWSDLPALGIHQRPSRINRAAPVDLGQ